MTEELIKQLNDLQSKIRPECHIFIEHEEFFGWGAGVKTDHNRYPYWIKYNDETMKGAIEKLLGFFNGETRDHANNPRTAKDFLRSS